MSAVAARVAPSVSAAGSPQGAGTLRLTLAAMAARHGFSDGCYLHLGHNVHIPTKAPPAPQHPGETELLRLEPCWLICTGRLDAAAYRRRGYLSTDPLAARAARSFTPFSWSLAALEDEQDPRCRPLLRALKAWDMGSGVVAPIQDTAAGPALVNLFGPTRAPAALDDHEASSLATHAAFMFAAARLHETAKALLGCGDPRGGGVLNVREMEVLRLAAHGRTEQETARSLALSRRGVQFHLVRAAEKLGAPNKIAAVARAVGMGLIAVQGDASDI